MKRIASMIAVLAVATLSLVWSPAAAAATITSGPQPITLNVTLTETLTLACTPSTITFTGTGGTLAASAPISCQTTWSLATGHTSLTVLQYFTSGFVFTGQSIGPNAFSSSVDGGAATAFSATSSTIAGTTGFFGPNLLSNAPPAQSGSHTDTSLLSFNTAGLPPGSYTATLNILAVVQ